MRRKRWIGALLIIASLLIALLPAPEADAASSASEFFIRGDVLKKYSGTEKVVTVPKSVATIGEGAFQENTTVEKVVLADSVKNIEAYAFWGCDHLETVVLGKGLTDVDDFAFTNCTGLTNITIPSNIRRIGIQAFAYCNRLEDITIPPQVTEIKEDAFEGDYLLNIHCEPGSYADKYAQAFYERQKDMTVYEEPADEQPAGPSGSGNAGNADPGEAPSGVESASGLLGSTHVVANQAVVFIQNSGGSVVEGNEGSGGAEQGEEEIDMSWLVPERAHYRDNRLTRVEVEEGILEIGSFAYARSSLFQLTLPKGLEKIDYAAFYYCDSLVSVELPDTVKEVGPKAFTHTPWLEKFLSVSGDAAEEDPFLISGGVLVSYRGAAEEVIVPEGVRVIAGEAFADHVELKKVILPESLQSIGERAFANCGLESVEDIEYRGSALSEAILEECVRLADMGAAPVRRSGFRWNWGLAAVMLAAGTFCLLSRRRVL